MKKFLIGILSLIFILSAGCNKTNTDDTFKDFSTESESETEISEESTGKGESSEVESDEKTDGLPPSDSGLQEKPDDDPPSNGEDDWTDFYE